MVGEDETTYSGQLTRYNDTNCSTLSQAPNITQIQDYSQCFLYDNTTLDIYAQITECVLSVPTAAPSYIFLSIQPQISTYCTYIYTAVRPKFLADEQIEQLATFYQFFLGVFLIIFGVVVVLSWIDAWYIRINDYFKLSAIATMIFQTTDMMSDCFFTAELSVQYKVLNKLQ